MTPQLDGVKLAFDQDNLFVLEIVLGFVMFGVALDLKLDDFKQLVKQPKAPGIGLLAQFLLLPALTWLLSRALLAIGMITPSMALGMILIAACPGGNVSNFITHLAGGRTTTSIGMTAVSTTASVLMTPLNIGLWGSISPETSAILTEVALDPVDMLRAVMMMLGIPIVVGVFLATRFPTFAKRVHPPFKWLSVIFFVTFIVLAVKANSHVFVPYLPKVFLPVFIMNALALALGFWLAKLGGLDESDQRAVSIEVGIQNSGLGLILIFAFFAGLGGMAMIAAWWGIWHIIAGLTLAFWWTRRDRARAGT
ncbi:Na(+) dependent transporter,Sodium Bile acid symporter family protein [Enhygromyxa salina]|uniref:Na(+) dependent transporter,Sodium Bile acid symporter family protein n=1 Tax=Enhygromyxa salina TaxID=215803 RepID=A0A0C2D3R1_9BACT|nr:bile acid:sodium symporter family protein [Enhygromyxa salina]KIG17861.1 Na(+) dependent transporter,Sodium Bile acid symporter family protein [Enhygromyxa salina]